MSDSTTLLFADRVWAPASDRNQRLVRTATLVIGFALLTAALAQFEVHLSFTPVPITGQTLGVLLAGAALGWRSGALSQGLYWVLGLVGLPFYSGGDGGWKNGTAFNEIEILGNDEGKPEVYLLGKTAETFAAMKLGKILVSLSHLKTMASAVIIIESL